MGLQKFQKNILKATHNLEFSAVLVFPDSSITLDIRVSVPTILVLFKIDISGNMIMIILISISILLHYTATAMSAASVMGKFETMKRSKISKASEVVNNLYRKHQLCLLSSNPLGNCHKNSRT